MKIKKNVILDFSCKGCGICCKEEGYVFFSSDDISRASRFLSVTPVNFIKEYLKYNENLGYYIEVLKSVPCLFLDDKNHCKIHEAKPWQCKTFPYWEEYMDKRGNLISGKFDRPCPGVFPKD